jgi:transcriptional regulator with XRE-family HTH domain
MPGHPGHRTDRGWPGARRSTAYNASERNWLNVLRLDQKLTLQDLARRMKCTQQNAVTIMAQGRDHRMSTVLKTAHALNYRVRLTAIHPDGSEHTFWLDEEYPDFVPEEPPPPKKKNSTQRRKRSA